ncbi:hypothetical protein Acel_2147 [Acidothermus cellulolyticus 11B]|uniref:Zinc-finger domain-containing protein n=1 Tax=Acidothermus cellulolyticus (strain ATCC 43068 / DSM 8971 / 11B) TaxID=351607 RepID=A0LWV9_ACIC1|nr:hypothetical protein [Acidothermus cellulolyticus]ABK53919.1 hypothetical protein Acel_2147 [Acidothermus cellulolyticus 11B]
MTEHPDAATLAGIAAGETAELPDVDEHLSDCAECRQTVTELQRIPQLLRALQPVPMPADIAERIDQAIRRDDENPVSILPRRRRFARTPVLAAAGVLILAAVGTVVALRLQSDHSRRASPVMEGSSRTVMIASGTNYTPDLLQHEIARVLANRRPDLASAFPAVAKLASASPSSASGTRAQRSTSGNNSTSSSAAQPVPAAAPTAPAGRLANAANLQACVTALAGRPVSPLLADFALFDGNPATVMVFVDPDDPGVLDVYVEREGADCSQDVTFFARLTAGG